MNNDILNKYPFLKNSPPKWIFEEAERYRLLVEDVLRTYPLMANPFFYSKTHRFNKCMPEDSYSYKVKNWWISPWSNMSSEYSYKLQEPPAFISIKYDLAKEVFDLMLDVVWTCDVEANKLFAGLALADWENK